MKGTSLRRLSSRERVLKRSKSFGMRKDDATRKKVKILDTSIRTDSGDCLDWDGHQWHQKLDRL